jgi:hypothetical protein
MKAKTASLVSKVLGITWIVVATILKATGVFDLGVIDIILVGVVIAAIFVTVDINIMLDKITKGKIDPAKIAQDIGLGAEQVAK